MVPRNTQGNDKAEKKKKKNHHQGQPANAQQSLRRTRVSKSSLRVLENTNLTYLVRRVAAACPGRSSSRW